MKSNLLKDFWSRKLDPFLMEIDYISGKKNSVDKTYHWRYHCNRYITTLHLQFFAIRLDLRGKRYLIVHIGFSLQALIIQVTGNKEI